MLTITLALCGIILLSLIAIVIYSNHRASANQWLSVFMGSGLLWLLANLFANIAPNDKLYLFFSQAALVGAALVPFTFLMFCVRFTGRKLLTSRLKIAIVFLPILVLLLSTPTDFNIRRLTSSGTEIEPGASYLLLLVIFIIYFVWGISNLMYGYKHANNVGKEQLRYILIGTALTVTPALIMSGILPIFGYNGAVSFAPAVVIFFAAFTTVAIAKYKLFDIRSYVIRAAAYAFTTLTLSVLYVAPAVYVLGVVVMDYSFEWNKFVLGVLVGTIAALNYERVRSWFNRSTNKIFFRDSYDAASMIGELNKILVSNIDLNILLHKSADLITKNFKADFSLFVLKETANAEQRIIGSELKNVSEFDILKARNITADIDQNVIITDFLPEELSSLKRILMRNDIAMVAHLSSKVGTGAEGLGYILLGFKKSGNPYNKQDVQTLEAIADVLTLAIQNALHFEEIQNFNITLQQRIDEATRKLKRTNAKLEALDETKDDFISMASHQLRTPLTAVKGYLSMVLEGDAGKITPMQKKMLGQAFMSSQRMVFLIADLLNVSRLKTGKFVIDRTPINLATMIHEEIGQLQETAASRALTLEFDSPKDFPELMMDETKTRQVVMNFVDNAIHYTRAGGKIRIELSDKPHTVELRVHDDGIGVPKSEQHHLFTKFYRAVNARRERPDGTGLGLFMAKKVVVAQGGAVIFDSKEGKGSTFGFIMPKEKYLVQPTPMAETVSATSPPQ